MRTPRRCVPRTTFRMLSGEAQRTLTKYEHTVICLMVLIAVTSIVWSVSIHILSGDFYNDFIGAKLAFHKRDFTQMNAREKETFYKDLGQLINETYTNAAVENLIRNKEISKELLIMPDEDTILPIETSTTSTTKKPKPRKIAHLFQISSNSDASNGAAADDNEDNEDDEESATAQPKIKFDPKKDRKFLASMTIDIHQTHWSQSTAVQFIYSFPFLSEMVAIIWTAMCLIFQSGVKKYWGLPKPWRIVVPSILMFSLMTLSTLTYTLLANAYLKEFCHDLKASLTNNKVLTCGQAISVLRPFIIEHEFKHDVYLNLFRISYLLVLVFWCLALLLMVMRYIFAIDFQLVDIQPMTLRKLPQVPLLRTPSHAPQLLQLQVDERHRSEDDFQSAKSHMSDAVTPLLEHKAAA